MFSYSIVKAFLCIIEQIILFIFVLHIWGLNNNIYI